MSLNTFCGLKLILKSRYIISMSVVFLFSGQARTSPFSLNPSDNSNIILNSYDKFVFTEKFKRLYKYRIYITSDDLNLHVINMYFGEANIGNIHLMDRCYYKKKVDIECKNISEYISDYDNNPDWDKNYGKYHNSIEQHYKILDCYNLFRNDNNSDINIKNCDFVFRVRLDTEFENDLCDILENFKVNPKLELFMCWDWGIIGNPDIMNIVCNGLDHNYGKFGYDIDISYIPKFFHEVYGWNRLQWKYAPERQLFEMIFTYYYKKGIIINDDTRIYPYLHFVNVVR